MKGESDYRPMLSLNLSRSTAQGKKKPTGLEWVLKGAKTAAPKGKTVTSLFLGGRVRGGRSDAAAHQGFDDFTHLAQAVGQGA